MQGCEMMLRATMTAHKFTVGEAVSFSPDKGQEHTGGELFEIVHLLPETRDALQYRIKSQTNDHERVVRTRGAANPRFVVTSLSGEDAAPQQLYEEIYCARGDMENRIKE